MFFFLGWVGMECKKIGSTFKSKKKTSPPRFGQFPEWCLKVVVFESENLIPLAEILHHLRCKKTLSHFGASCRRCGVVRSLHARARPDSVSFFCFNTLTLMVTVCIYIYIFLLFDTYFDLYDSSSDWICLCFWDMFWKLMFFWVWNLLVRSDVPLREKDTSRSHPSIYVWMCVICAWF